MWPAGWKRDADAAYRERLAIPQRFDEAVRSEAALQEARGRPGAEVRAAATPRVIAVGVGDQRAIDRTPRIDVETAGRTEEAGGSLDEHAVRVQPPAVFSRRAFMNSQTIGMIEMKMMMMATIEKFFFTISMLPKRYPRPKQDATQSTAPATL